MTSRNNPATGGPGKKPSKSQIRQKQAAQRAMAAASGARAARNKRLVQVGVPLLVVVAVVGILVGVYAGQNHNKKGNTASAASNAVTQAVTSVPASVYNKVGDGGAGGPAKTLTGAALTANGKPRVLYIGADWCPYCAAERWPLAAALSRFGTLTNLGQTASSPNDTDPNTATLSFHGAKFTSSTIALTAKEVEDGNHNKLDAVSASDNALWMKLTGNRGSFPFIDIGGKYQFGVQYDPAILAGKTHAQIADAMQDPTSSIGKTIDGAANILTAAICETTNGQPANVCTASGVVAAKAKLTNAGG